MMTDVLCSAEKHELVKKKIQHSALVLRFWKTAWIAAQIEFPCTPCNEVSPCRLYKAEAFSSILAYCWCLGTRLCCTSGSGVGVDQFQESRGERSERSPLLFESKTACSVQTPALEEEIVLACEKWAGSCGMACQGMQFRSTSTKALFSRRLQTSSCRDMLSKPDSQWQLNFHYEMEG